MDEQVKKCEVCDEYTEEAYLFGCEGCARLFGPCCNSDTDDRCVECGDKQVEED